MQPFLLQADKLGIKLEIVKGMPIWEAQPIYRHQAAVDRIRSSIKKTKSKKNICQCVHIPDVYINFPDGSLKRPDISIFCREPEELDEAIKAVPDAVIEVISKGYEKKDTETGMDFYIEQGVKDVVIFDPYTLSVIHSSKNNREQHLSPVKLTFDCGCMCIV